MDFTKTIINAIKIWVNKQLSFIENKIADLENRPSAFIQPEEPSETPDGTLWIDLDEESSDIIEIEIDSELSETSENPVQNKVINTAINNLNNLIGDTAVAEQIENAIASIPEAPVTSVNGQTGDIVINIPSVKGLATETYVNNAIDNIEMPEVPVTSVNGMTGDIQINIPTVEGLATEEYVNNAVAAVDVPVTSVNGMTGDVIIEIPESFSGSWNDLTDKPFGETGNGAIVTWNGNIDGLDVINILENPHYKVSNLMPTLEDISIGYNTLITKGIIIPDDSLDKSDDFTACPGFIVARKDNLEINGRIIPKAGIYFSLSSSKIDYQFMSSLSFNDKIITWDGKTEGLEYISPLSKYSNWYKVSDYIPSNDELTNLIAEENLVRQNEILINNEKHLLLSGGNVLVIYEAGEYDDAGNIVNFPSTGIYFLRQDGEVESYVSKLEYGNITIQTLDEKFIPDTIARKNDILVTSVNGMTGDVIIEANSNDNQIFWTEEETAVLFSGTDLDFSNMVVQQTADFEFVEGAEYTITIDGVANTYIGTNLSYGDISYVFIGNMSSGPLAAVQDGILAIMIQDGGIHSVEISGLKQIYHFDEDFAKASQSNWSEEDTNSINYIKNKPFYKELRKEVALIADRQRTYTKTEEITSNGEPIYYTEATLLAEPIIGESYRIGASAVEMVNRECQHNGSFKYLGNLHLHDREYTDTRESFCFIFEEGPMVGESENTVGNRRYVRIYTTRPVDKTYSFIFGDAYEYVSIDNRYLNCFVPWLSDGALKGQVPMAMNDGYCNEWKPVSLPCWLEEGTPVVEEFTAECTKVAHQYAMYASCNDAVESVTELYKNFKYTVIWNGRPYEVYCDVTTWTMGSDFHGTAYFLGNLDLFDFDGRYADESSNAVYPTYSSIPNNRYPDLPFLIFVNDHNTEGQLGVVYVQGNEPQIVTVGIYAGVHQYHQLDERFIPDTIARVSDIPAFPEIPEINYPVTSVNGQTGDVIIDIPSTEDLATEEYVNEKAEELQENIDTVASAVELLTNGVDAETVDGVNDLIVYVNEHGAEVTGMKADIKANADALAKLAPVAKTGSWNDLEDKPTELSAGLNIKGPSNTSGLLNNMGYYKVSDVVPTLDDFARGCTFTDASGNTETYTASQITLSFWRGLNVIKPPSGAPGFFVLPQNGTFSGVTFTPGVYFNQRNNSIAHTLTAPGKEVFKKDLLNIVWDDVGDKPTSYPSDWNNIANKPNLFASTWDEIENKPIKDIADLVINKPSGAFVAAGFHGFKNVSNAIPTVEDLQNGFTVTFTNGNVIHYSTNDIIIGDYFNSGIINIYPSDLSFIIFPEDGSVDGSDAPSGVYFEEKYTKTLTINPRTILDPERVKVSWNGIDNAPEIEIPVTSVNGQTGDVVIDIPSTEGLATEEYVNSAITNINTYYTKAEIDNMEFITLDEIDAICARTIEVVSPTSGTF